ncbi:carbohydrate sulfotransferase 9 [Callorhinchus milii]|uniref:carbohydrate sulfotransferase 9 n=1 Tax=Callorhinchus milii TaxID=7868 RepID=UPI000457182A|nr:carbohydrate sulfotransferase 9 [Callorhinchus milii]XP_007893281.1 carbohydrate sulfotransferase 9 [Callorhinchus milii]|eukprot:gi/632955054/ref/XP_007893280.1/ PREDICTED: carbohydrate sulfotransferase 9 [Callorhinchus milii]
MLRASCNYKETTGSLKCRKDMKLRHVFLSILSFGVAGLLLFMYLHAWIDEQPTVPRYKMQEDPNKKEWNKQFRSAGRNATTFTNGKVGQIGKSFWPTQTNETFEEAGESLKHKLAEQKKMRNLLIKKYLYPISYQLAFRPPNRTQQVTDGSQEKRKALLAEFCQKYHSTRHRASLIRLVSRIYVEDKYKLLYCEVPKAGCSNWKRILMVLNGLASSPDNISHDSVHYSKSLRRLDSYNIKDIHDRFSTYTKVVFVRDPMERLVSAFRDKFEHSNNYYHPVFGKAILKKYRVNASVEALDTGSGVTFREFAQYLLDAQRPVGMDIHWEQISKLCSPCLIDYDFIGKFETLETDANHFLKLIGAPPGLHFPSFKDRHSTDERTTPTVVQQYLAQLSSVERQKTYNFYYLDYLMFNYSMPRF